MGKTLGKSIIAIGIVGIVMNFSSLRLNLARQLQEKEYISQRISPISQQIFHIKNTPIHALYNDPNIPRNLDGLVRYYRDLIEERDKIENSQEITDARKIESRRGLYTAASALGLVFSLATCTAGALHYKQNRQAT